MFGWKEFLGHLTSSGTFANLEALWMAGQMAPGRRIVGSEQAHYTHQRISGVLKLGYTSVRRRARADEPGCAGSELRKGDVGTVVATLGTTAMGAVDPLDEILKLKERYGFRVHVDAAYGGYFGLISESLGEPARGRTRRSGGGLDCDRSAQARAAAVWVRMRAVSRSGGGAIYKHDSPYTYFTSKELAPGRDQPGVLARRGGGGCALGDAKAAAACSGRGVCTGVGEGTARGGGAGPATASRREVCKLGGIASRVPKCEGPGAPAEFAGTGHCRVGASCGNSRRGFGAGQKSVRRMCRSRVALGASRIAAGMVWFGLGGRMDKGSGTMTCLRSVLMKPEHEAWMGEIWDRLSAASGEVEGT
jgi:tyrosine decarboxylase / aspartate 1-decarboxylase